MSAPEDVEALLAEHQPVYESDGDYGEMSWVECSCGDEYAADVMDEDAHRAHVAAVLAAYVVEKQREAVLGAADLIDSGPSFPLSPSVISELVREHAATTYPTPKETR